MNSLIVAARRAVALLAQSRTTREKDPVEDKQIALEAENILREALNDHKNIRLIAAAPALLEACQFAASWPTGTDPEVVAKCEAAIALARGEGS